MNNDSIYYYTSNFVLDKWLDSEIIWATRSVTSNDNYDTIYVIKHFDELCKEIGTNFNYTKNQLLVSKKFCLGLQKDILRFVVDNDFKKFKEIVNNAYDEYSSLEQIKQIVDLAKNYGTDIDKSGLPIIKGAEIQEILFTNILLSLPQELIQDFFNVNVEVPDRLVRTLPTFSYPFVICFTYNCDNRFFWDSYTNNIGVCIEFCKEELVDHFKNTYQKEKTYLFDFFNDIIYDDNKQKEFLKEIIEAYKESKKMGIDESDVINLLAASCKHPFWKPENEFRAIFSAKYFIDDRFTIKENYNLKYINENTTQDYIEISIPKHLVKSITLAPLNNLDYNQKLKNKLEMSNIIIKESIGKGIICK